MVEIRNSGTKTRLETGKTATAVSGFNTPEIIDFLGQFGFDAVWIDMEHTSVTWDQLGNMTRACDLWGMTSLVRVTSNEPSLITRALDVGATGVVVPHVNTKTAAERAVRGAKYGPLGKRGMFSGRQSYGVENYHGKANTETMVVALIEEQEAVGNLKEILTVEGIDVFLIGPGDLSQSMGYLGEPHHPKVKAEINRVVTDIVAAGKVAGALATADTVECLYNKGFRFYLTIWKDWLAQGAIQYMGKIRSLDG